MTNVYIRLHADGRAVDYGRERVKQSVATGTTVYMHNTVIIYLIYNIYRGRFTHRFAFTFSSNCFKGPARRSVSLKWNTNNTTFTTTTTINIIIWILYCIIYIRFIARSSWHNNILAFVLYVFFSLFTR